MAQRKNPWLRLSWDAWMLGAECASVMALRGLKLSAGGPDAERETGRMVEEKIEAAQAWQALALTGAMGLTAPQVADRTIKHYRRKVRANRRRLIRSV